MIDLATVARGDGSRIVERRRAIARTADEWRALWALHAGPDAAAPPLDFDGRIVAAAFAGQMPSAGYAIEIVGARTEGRTVRLIVEERVPGPGRIAAQILSSPFHIVSLPRTDAPIQWSGAAELPDAAGHATDPASPVPHTGRFSAASSTGLTPKTASTLAYLAGPFSGLLILLAESRNADVRFHAWQSIVGLGGLSLIVALMYFAAFASLFVSATAVSLIVRLATVTWIGLLAVWAICLWKASRGERWKLPLAGNAAERLANRRTLEP